MCTSYRSTSMSAARSAASSTVRLAVSVMATPYLGSGFRSTAADSVGLRPVRRRDRYVIGIRSVVRVLDSHGLDHHAARRPRCSLWPSRRKDISMLLKRTIGLMSAFAIAGTLAAGGGENSTGGMAGEGGGY